MISRPRRITKGLQARERQMVCVYLAQQMFTDAEIQWISEMSKATVKATLSKYRNQGYEVPYAWQREKAASDLQTAALLRSARGGKSRGRVIEEEDRADGEFRPPAGMAASLDARIRPDCNTRSLVKDDQSG